MWHMFNGRQDDIRNSDMEGTSPNFMHTLLGKKQIIILSIQETSKIIGAKRQNSARSTLWKQKY